MEKREQESFWQAVVLCDPSYDGVFFYAVKTTGVYCRPSCKSRTPKREHVTFHTSALAAEAAGFRPCKRCRPKLLAPVPSVRQMLVEEAKRLIASHYAEDWTLRAMAERLYVSPFWFQRVFKQACGFTPFQYLTETRIRAAERLLLETEDSVTSIALQVGFKNPAHFSSLFAKKTGCPPSRYRFSRHEEREEFAK